MGSTLRLFGGRITLRVIMPTNMEKLRRSLQDEIIHMKQAVLDKCIAREMKCYARAKLLRMHPKSFSRLKREYLERGVGALMPKKPGSKPGSP